LGSALAYGASAVVVSKIVSDHAASLAGIAFSLLFGTIALSVVFYRQTIADFRLAPRRGLVMAALTGCASVVGVSFWFLGISQAPVVIVVPVSSVYPLISILLTHIFLQRIERVTWRTVLGTSMLAGGVVLIALGKE
jgi:transporter family protein